MQSSIDEKANLDLRSPISPKLRRNTFATWFRIVTLILGDLTLLSLAWVIAGNYGISLNSFWDNHPLSLLIVIGLEISFIISQGLYKSGDLRRNYFALVKAITFAHVILLIIAFLTPSSEFISRSTYLLSWVLSTALACTGRFSIDWILTQLRQRGAVRQNTILICPPEDTEKAYKLLESQNCYKTIKAVDASSLALDKSNLQVLIETIRYLGVSEVFVCSWSSIKDRMLLYWSLRNAGISLRILSLDLEAFYRKSSILMLGGMPTIQFSPPLVAGLDFWVKRSFDFVVSAFLIVLLAPLLLGIALFIKLDSPGPFFYKQERVGLHGNLFKVLKFRTMVVDADKLQKQLEAQNEMKDGVLFKMKDDPRITRVGKFLRRTSLDELPQLFNILFGQMSLVGPRPLPIRDVEKFSEHHFIRHEVMPGITGLWQVSGRSNITDFEQVVRLDSFYIENWSLWLDIQILGRTALVLLKRQGAY
ncbi:MAG TPA: sugar transferase [Coleofasciculaceae cyanobacterium]